MSGPTQLEHFPNLVTMFFTRARAKGGTVVLKGVRDQPLAIFQLLQLDRLMLRTGKTPPPSRDCC